MIIEKEIITGELQVVLPNGSIINRYSHVLPGCFIGKNVMIGEHCYVATMVKIDDGTRIQNGNNIYDGCSIGKNVFIAPNCTITNHHNPTVRNGEFIPDIVNIGDDCTICAGSVIVAPRVLGHNSLLAAGAVLTRDLKPMEICYGVSHEKINDSKNN